MTDRRIWKIVSAKTAHIQPQYVLEEERKSNIIALTLEWNGYEYSRRTIYIELEHEAVIYLEGNVTIPLKQKVD